MSRCPPAVVFWLGPLVVAAALLRPSGTQESRSQAVPTSAALPAPPALHPAEACPVTEPNGRRPPDPERVAGGTGLGGYGNDALWTNVWMWGEGGVPVPDSHVLPDGSLGPMKWAWYRYTPGHLNITGRRLDAPAPPLQVEHPGDYGERGFRPVGLIFPTGGCWEITGRVGEASLTFVTLVVPPPIAGAPGGSFLVRSG